VVRAQQESVLHTRLAAQRVGNPGGSKPRPVNPLALSAADKKPGDPATSYPILESVVEHQSTTTSNSLMLGVTNAFRRGRDQIFVRFSHLMSM
jgi:hypothetical protein